MKFVRVYAAAIAVAAATVAATASGRSASPQRLSAERAHRVRMIAAAPAQAVPPKPTAHATRRIEGWLVHVDRRLLGGADKTLGERALHILSVRLYEITLALPADKVERLREVPIWIDRTHGALKSMQYHPSADWLRENGYCAALARCVHIPDAAYFASSEIQFQQPWAILHELAHAYHDQVLGFENAEIIATWQRFRDGGKYASVPHMNGRMRPHYGLTDQKEFFAEMTETYFGMNDFYPFNRAELQRAEPDLAALIGRLWERGLER